VDEGGIGRSEDGSTSHLALALPVLNVVDVAAATKFNVLAGADKHTRGGYDVGDRMFPWMVARDPDRDRNVVGRLAVGDGERAVETEQELGPSVVVCCGEGERGRRERERRGAL